MTSPASNTPVLIPEPLVVLDAIAYCDAIGQHEARIVTDGTRAHAALTGTPYYDLPVARDAVTLSGSCPAPDYRGAGGTCPGTLTWSLDTEGAWTNAPASVTLLTTYGQTVDR